VAVKPTVALGAVTSVLAFAEARRPGTAAQITRDIALDLPPPGPDARVAAAIIPELLGAASRLTGDLSLGLHLAQAADSRRFGLLSYIASASRDLREAYAHVARFLALWNEGVELRFVSSGGKGVIEVRSRLIAPSVDGLRQLLELSTATLLSIGRRFSGQELLPSEVTFATAPPPRAARAELERYFGRVSYGRMTTQIVLSESALELQLTGADPALTSILTRHAEELLGRLSAQASWRGRTRDMVIAGLGHGRADVVAVAGQMGVGVRTLQRRLAGDGTAFNVIVDEARFELATRYLRETSLSQTEIAYMLGFAELSAYYHAFKRWTGSTPAEHRRRLTPADNSLSPRSKGIGRRST
jgi:AraC-like DNA-binding protein